MALGVVVVMALFTALIAPYFIDWTAYKRDFEAQASRIFGQPVLVGGQASVRILPLPSITFTRISVGQNGDGTPLLAADRFSANVELMPFLSGEVRVVDMTVDRPVFNLQIGEEGGIAWTQRQDLIVDPDQVKLDKLTIRNGSVTVTGLSPGHVIEAAAIDADVSAKSLFGPWQIEASGLLEGEATRMRVATGRLQESGTIRFKMEAEREDLPYRIAMDGPVGVRDGILGWTGSFSINPGRDAAGSGTKALPVVTEGSFDLQPTRLIVPDYRMEIGPREDPFTLTGKANANLRNAICFRMEVDGRQIRFGPCRADARQGSRGCSHAGGPHRHTA